MGNLRVVTWNANGLRERRLELEMFLNAENIDIALISETRITAKTYISIKNFKVYTTNHPSGNTHGGTAILIKQHIKHFELEAFCTEKIQATSIKIQNDNIETSISAIYCPPRHTTIASDFEAYFSTLGPRFICGGDWNSKHVFWGSRLITCRGRQLFQTIRNLSLDHVSCRTPTYWPTDQNKTPDLLDFYITKGISHNYLKVETCIDLSSDHTPVILNYSSRVLFVKPIPRIHSRKTNWELYQNIISSEVNLNIPLKTELDIEQNVERINILLHRAAHESTPPYKETEIRPKLYPKEIREQVIKRRNLRKTWHRRRYPSDKKAFNDCSEKLKQLIQTYTNDDLQNYLSGLTPTSNTEYSLWKATRKMKRPTTHIPPIKKRNGKWARSNLEKAAEYADYLETVFKPHDSSDSDHDEEVRSYLRAPLQMCLPLKSCSPKEVRKSIKCLKPRKAPGYDQIDDTLLKKLPHKGLMLLVILFNACLRLSHFPSQWKIAQVVMVPKPGKPPQETSSYRPISLLPVIGKVFERILLNRLSPHLQEVIPSHQFGFRSKHNTVEQIHRLVDVISRTLENKQYCSAVFVDIGQAFDKVWHEGLLYKAKKLLPHSFNRLLESYLHKRCYEVKCNDETSTLYEIKSGVPQGSILGPVLYLLFTADLPTNECTTTATYADDTAILSVHENPDTASLNLQKHLSEIENWFTKWRIKANQSKSTHVTFTLCKKTCPPVKLYDDELPQAEDAKYLGMHLDRRLTWRKHIWTKRKQLDMKLRSLYWLTGKKSQLTPASKIAVYKAILKPIWTYGIQLWGTASTSNVEILERFQNKAMRIMFNIPPYISNKNVQKDLNIKTVREEIEAYSKKYQERLAAHVNNLANKLEGEGSLRFYRLKRNSVPDLSYRFANK